LTLAGFYEEHYECKIEYFHAEKIVFLPSLFS